MTLRVCFDSPTACRSRMDVRLAEARRQADMRPTGHGATEARHEPLRTPGPEEGRGNLKTNHLIAFTRKQKPMPPKPKITTGTKLSTLQPLPCFQPPECPSPLFCNTNSDNFKAAEGVCTVPTKALLAERILHLPRSIRHLLIEKYYATRGKQKVLADPANNTSLLGMFEVKLLIQSYKTNHEHDTEWSTFTPQMIRNETFNIMPAGDADTMFLSVPHSILALALRTGSEPQEHGRCTCLYSSSPP